MEVRNRILVIDDEIEVLLSCKNMLRVLGYDARGTSDCEEGIKWIKEEDFDLILCDLLMPGKDGKEVLTEVSAIKPELPVIIFSAYGTIDRAVACMKIGAFDFIEKPFEADHLKLVIEKALKYKKLFSERENLLKQLEEKYKFENIIGKSPAITRIFEMVASVADSDANVLITGESGTGKELIARSIHAKGKRNTQPFVPVNCGALPENLFESELFGYEKGAFTNAENQKTGLIEFADKGSFFLDEVCELPINMQSKLLRVMQEKKVRKLGGNELTEVDVRWISATNRDILSQLKEERLREDFYYRLNVINIDLPPLRDRKGDIEILTEHFLKKYSEKSGKNIRGISSEVLEIFENYTWPGNVRELENAVERMVTFASEEHISIKNLDRKFLRTVESKENFGSLTLKEVKENSLSDVEKRYLVYLLGEFKGNITKISEAAGMTRRNTYRLLDRYKLNPDTWR